jgi:uncharacterized Zn finger protein
MIFANRIASSIGCSIWRPEPLRPVLLGTSSVAVFKVATLPFWGKSWCTNLERYSDYENRLPRGRTYVRNGSVVDLQIVKGQVSAVVSGSVLYEVAITIAPVTATRWKAICRDCAGTIDSLVELLQGRLSKGVMDRVCREGDGLFPAPKEIKLYCSCPDWAGMCKHVAAVLYGVGARLDERPALLFTLRGVDENQLLANAGHELSLKKPVPATTKVLDDGDVAALFGLEMVEAVRSDIPISPERSQGNKMSRGSRTQAGKRVVASKKGKRKLTSRQETSATASSVLPTKEEQTAKSHLIYAFSRISWTFLTRLHGLLTVRKVARQFEFNSLRQRVLRHSDSPAP